MRSVWILVVLTAFAMTAQARFAQSQGFSGKHGVDCGSCHLPTAGGLDAPAQVRLDGLPSAWNTSHDYALTITVSGGPMPNPLPGQPQGGFDLETDQGTLRGGASMDGLLRFPTPQEATYTGAGTMRRTWQVVWTAPDASTPPQDAGFWLAGLSANGNHVVNGPDTAGERGDRFATLHLVVPPSGSARGTWEARPIEPPTVNPLTSPVDVTEGPAVVSGAVPLGADGAEWRVDALAWSPAIGSPGFFLQLPALDAGMHELDVRTVEGNRTSEPTTVSFEVASGAAAASASAPPWIWAAFPVAAGLLLAPFVLKLFR